MTEFLFAAVLFAISFVLAVKHVVMIFRVALDEIAGECPRTNCWRFARSFTRKANEVWPGGGIKLQYGFKEFLK